MYFPSLPQMCLYMPLTIMNFHVTQFGQSGAETTVNMFYTENVLALEESFSGLWGSNTSCFQSFNRILASDLSLLLLKQRLTTSEGRSMIKQQLWQGGYFFAWLLHGSTSPLSGRSTFCHFFLELMPCALEALTVIQTSVVGQLFSSCQRTGENAKDWMSSTKTKKQQNNPNKQQTTHHPETKKTSSELSETVKLRFQNQQNPRSTQNLFTTTQKYSASRLVPQVAHPAYIPATDR